jgi:HEAT repeat protein
MLQFNFDFLSFIAGFVAATIFWVVLWRLRTNWPQIRSALQNQMGSARKKNLLDVETYLKQGTYRRAQRQHLAAALFPLEEILVPPMVVAPPASPDADGNMTDESALEKLIPYLPDWPELAAEYGYLVRPLSEVAAQRADIALIGRPGVGKTTVLADFASAIVQKKFDDPRLIDSFPLFFHVLDLKPILLNNQDAADALVDSFTAKTAVTLQKQARTAVRLALHEGRAILFLDGLDEIHPTEVAVYSKYLQAVKAQYPNLQILAACSDLFLDGLVAMGFTPIAVAPWNQLQVHEFVLKWGKVWKELIIPQITKAVAVPQPDPLAMENWIMTDGLFYTPFEWTELVWGAYAGDLSGSQPQRGIEAHLKRVFQGEMLSAHFGALAAAMLASEHASLPFEQAEDILTRFSNDVSRDANIPTSPDASTFTQDGKEKAGLSAQLRKGSKVVVQTVGERMLLKAIEQGLLVEYGENQIAFSHLPVAAHLAAIFNQGEVAVVNPQWALSLQTAHYCASDGKNQLSILQLLAPDSDPLRSNLSRAGRILAATPPNSELRIQIMRRLIGEIQQEQLPFGTRARLMVACAISNDPSICLLFRQWLAAPSPALRRLAALGSGLLKDGKSVKDLTDLLSDADFLSHSTAAAALTVIPGDAALNAVSIALSQGVETIRRVIAESMAVQPNPTGQEILKEAVSMDDLLVRRAAVFGLALLHTPWAHELLSQIAVEDGQWVVRNAAGQVLEQHQQPDPHIPTPSPHYWESPWLVTFAGKHGLGVSPDEPPLKLLFQALDSGTEEDRVMALKYLNLFSGEETTKAIQNLLAVKDEEISERALQSLWCLSTVGETK